MREPQQQQQQNANYSLRVCFFGYMVARNSKIIGTSRFSNENLSFTRIISVSLSLDLSHSSSIHHFTSIQISDNYISCCLYFIVVYTYR